MLLRWPKQARQRKLIFKMLLSWSKHARYNNDLFVTLFYKIEMASQNTKIDSLILL